MPQTGPKKVVQYVDHSHMLEFDNLKLQGAQFLCCDFSQNLTEISQTEHYCTEKNLSILSTLPYLKLKNINCYFEVGPKLWGEDLPQYECRERPLQIEIV